MNAVFKALGDSTRRSLLDRLHAENCLTLAQLCEGTGMSRQAVSKHLAILEEANLIVAERKGRHKRYFINPVPIAEIARRWIRKYEQDRVETLVDLKGRMEEKSD